MLENQIIQLEKGEHPRGNTGMNRFNSKKNQPPFTIFARSALSDIIATQMDGFLVMF